MKTALHQYARLEATGLWRPAADEQRREVIVSFGEASVTICNTRGEVLTHWSFAAIRRANKGERPAIYHPEGDPGETLEFDDDASDMIDALERLRRVIEKRRPRPGRLRLWMTLTVAAALALVSIFWLPGALVSHTLSVLPKSKRADIGRDMLGHFTRVAGRICNDPAGLAALDKLSTRLFGQPGRLIVVSEGTALTAHLPGRVILLNRKLVEDWEDPEVIAGFILSEAIRLRANDPMAAVLEHAGLIGSLRLLTTGHLPDDTMRDYAESVMSRSPARADTEALLNVFAQVRVSSRPYAYALDVTGETTLDLIEGDPMQGQSAEPVLRDADWVQLQQICETPASGRLRR